MFENNKSIEQFKDKVKDLIFNVCKATGRPINKSDIKINVIKCHYDISKIENPEMKDKMMVYMFYYDKEGVFLKIGIAGPNSTSRAYSQHYTYSKRGSCLLKSIYKDKNNIYSSEKSYHGIGIDNLATNRELIAEGNKKYIDEVSKWIQNNCTRIEIILDCCLIRQNGFKEPNLFDKNHDYNYNQLNTEDNGQQFNNKFLINLIEKTMHYVFTPRYEEKFYKGYD